MSQRPIRSIVEQREVVTAPEQMTVSEAARVMRNMKAGAMQIVSEGRLVGIFTERDALFRVVAEGRDPTATRLAEVMTRNPKTITANKLAVEAAELIQRHRIGTSGLLVVDGDGKLAGAVHMLELMRAGVL